MRLQNVTVRLLLLPYLVLTLAACHSLRPISSGDRPTRKSPTTEQEQLRQNIADYSTQQEGAKYKYGARGPRHFDCSGLTCYVYKAHDIELPGGSYNQARLGKKISLRAAQPGDLVFFGKSGRVNHVAIVLRNSSAGLEVVHSTSSRGVIQENISVSSYWKPRILFVRDIVSSMQ